MYSCGRDSTFKYKTILHKWVSVSVLKFSRSVTTMVQFMWLLNKLFQATYYCTERWNVRKQNPCEPGVTTSWNTRDSIADRARNSFPYTPSGHNTSKPQVVKRDRSKFTLRSIPKASVDLRTLQRKEIGMCQWDGKCFQEQRIAHAQSFPPVPPTHTPQLLVACPNYCPMDIDGTTTRVSTDHPLATQYGGLSTGTPHFVQYLLFIISRFNFFYFLNR